MPITLISSIEVDSALPQQPSLKPSGLFEVGPMGIKKEWRGGSSYLKMKNKNQEKYLKTTKGKAARTRAQKKYDQDNLEKRREQKKTYMRRKRADNPSYCKWK